MFSFVADDDDNDYDGMMVAFRFLITRIIEVKKYTGSQQMRIPVHTVVTVAATLACTARAPTQTKPYPLAQFVGLEHDGVKGDNHIKAVHAHADLVSGLLECLDDLQGRIDSLLLAVAVVGEVHPGRLLLHRCTISVNDRFGVISLTTQLYTYAERGLSTTS